MSLDEKRSELIGRHEALLKSVGEKRSEAIRRHESLLKALEESRVEAIRRHEADLKALDGRVTEAIRRHEGDLKAIDERQALRVSPLRETLLTIRVPIHTDDLETVAAMLYVMGGEEPVKIKGVPALYSVKCRPEEATELRAQIEALYAQRINVAAIREECLKRLP